MIKLKKMALDYSKKVMKEFLHPKNTGEIKNPDGVGEEGNPACGDIMHMEIKVKNNKLSDIKFKTFGCAAAIASTSILTQIAKGKSLEEAEKITLKDIEKELKGLPKIKLHCSGMATKALRKAIDNYKSKQKK